MKILYIHGLKSDPPISNEKRTVLEQYGTVLAPKMPYFDNKEAYGWLKNQIEITAFDVIIGTSMGGLMAYYLTKEFKKPGLVFNPAVSIQSIDQQIDAAIKSLARSDYLQVVLGKKDDVIPMDANLTFILEDHLQDELLVVSVRDQMEHRVPVDVFEEEVSSFFKTIQ